METPVISLRFRIWVRVVVRGKFLFLLLDGPTSTGVTGSTGRLHFFVAVLTVLLYALH